MLKRLIKSVLLVCLGCAIGVFLCQYSYFTLSKEISLTEVFIAILTGIIALYIADDLSAKLSRTQSVKALYTEDIKGFIVSLQTLENWIEEGECSAKELKRYLRNGTVKINLFVQIYGSQKGLNTNTLGSILNSFNALKYDITEIPPSSKGELYKFNLEQQHQFSQQVNGLKAGLVDAMIKS